eukprot:TRINITY_DN60777_c0_g1_i1.p1 TRINITY_DN60777_c0_g1~~TRINITY_DN60777_c0_g1_i1.p1  ORF type:complete len:173 (+),score=35.65 TRINITY_DN60777_c0_g1_i1:80-598(+)
MPAVSLGDLARRDEEENGRGPTSFYNGGDKSGLGIIHPGSDKDKDGAANTPANTPVEEPPAPSQATFSGEGNTLGGSSSSSAAAVQADKGTVNVDASKPKGKIQIRFHDGSRKAQEFNEDHTVLDLRNFCAQCVGGQAMTIMGGFPPKPVTDDALTLKDAGLLNAAVTVKPA